MDNHESLHRYYYTGTVVLLEKPILLGPLLHLRRLDLMAHVGIYGVLFVGTRESGFSYVRATMFAPANP